jgi:hypothetical protein
LITRRKADGINNKYMLGTSVCQRYTDIGNKPVGYCNECVILCIVLYQVSGTTILRGSV